MLRFECFWMIVVVMVGLILVILVSSVVVFLGFLSVYLCVCLYVLMMVCVRLGWFVMKFLVVLRKLQVLKLMFWQMSLLFDFILVVVMMGLRFVYVLMELLLSVVCLLVCWRFCILMLVSESLFFLSVCRRKKQGLVFFVVVMEVFLRFFSEVMLLFGFMMIVDYFGCEQMLMIWMGELLVCVRRVVELVVDLMLMDLDCSSLLVLLELVDWIYLILMLLLRIFLRIF